MWEGMSNQAVCSYFSCILTIGLSINVFGLYSCNANENKQQPLINYEIRNTIFKGERRSIKAIRASKKTNVCYFIQCRVDLVKRSQKIIELCSEHNNILN